MVGTNINQTYFPKLLVSQEQKIGKMCHLNFIKKINKNKRYLGVLSNVDNIGFAI